jgi:DNA processing protein
MDARASYIALNMVDGVGPVKVRAMIEALGSPEAIFQADAGRLSEIKGVGRELARRILEARSTMDIVAEERAAARLGAKIVTLIDPDYPPALKEIHDPPLALYVRGTLEARDRQSIAMVGSRRSSHYGRTVADRLGYQLAKVGLTVVSGLARGIDTAAHQGVLKGKGRTGAVLGSALDRLYPPENRGLAHEISESGFVMSEFHLGVEPGKTTFPMRNRVVAGLSFAVVVVEAPRGSGAMITAHQAMEQGRLVCAVPGRIDSPGSKGCHDLLKQGARLVDDVDDILEELEYLIPPERKAQARDLDARPSVQLTEPEEAVLRALWEGPLDVDTLSRRTGVPIAKLGPLLIGLEMKRVARMLPGRQVALSDGVRQQLDAGQ